MTSGAEPTGTGGVRALVIPVDQPPHVQVLASTELRALQQLIGGFVELHYPALSWHVYCHEGSSAGLRHLPENPVATKLVLAADASFRVVIRGTAVIVGTGYRGNDRDVPEELLRQL